MSEADINLDTPFGAYAELFVERNLCGRVESHGSSMLPSELKALKKRWRTCLWLMHHELDDRFPHDSMEVYELLKVVNPSISHSTLVHAEVVGIPKAEAVKTLLHIFELPLHGYLVSETVMNSFASYLISVIARDKFKAMNV
jgi:hypothetical protein